MLSYWLVFGSAFISATLLPFYSEAVLVSLIDNNVPWLLWLFATLGNTLGAAVNWWLGRYLLRFQQHRYFPFKAQQLQCAQKTFSRYGVWSLLFAWLPIIGDALTFIAGLMRVHFVIFITLTTLGKGARYAVVILLYLGFWD